MTALTQAKKPISRQQYKNLIATRDLLLWHPDNYSQGAWCSGNHYDFAGFAFLVKERIKVGDSIPNQDPHLANWLGLTQKEYARACYRVQTLAELLDAIESFLRCRVVSDEAISQKAKTQKAATEERIGKTVTVTLRLQTWLNGKQLTL
jgi:hypothetical protein